MSKKYSFEMKLAIVQEYLEGSLGSQLLVQKYNVSNQSLIYKWLDQYKKDREEGLRTRKTKTKYLLNFKLNVLRFKQDTGASYKDTAHALA